MSPNPEPTAPQSEPAAETLVESDLLVEDVSIDDSPLRPAPVVFSHVGVSCFVTNFFRFSA